MNDPNEYILYLEEHQVLACRSCKYCLRSNGIYQHLQTYHKSIPLTIRKELVQHAEGLILRDPTQVIASTRPLPAFECLKITEGFQCLICDSLCGTPESIEKHSRKAHKWKKSKGMSLC